MKRPPPDITAPPTGNRLTTLERTMLLTAAREAAQSAYCPYSKFGVGAAVLATDGRIFTGCNIENASYGLTVCAERVALAKAVSEGARVFRALAVAGGHGSPATPCGACRQVLAEFCLSDLPIYLTSLTNRLVKRVTLRQLLPLAFVLQKKRPVCENL